MSPGKLYRYVTSHPGQLAIHSWVGAMSTSLGWEGNRRSGVALAMRHKQYDLSTYELNGQLSLAIPSWVGARSTSLGWEDNRRSSVALAIRHR